MDAIRIIVFSTQTCLILLKLFELIQFPWWMVFLPIIIFFALCFIYALAIQQAAKAAANAAKGNREP